MGKEKGSDVPQWAMKDGRNKGKNNGELKPVTVDQAQLIFAEIKEEDLKFPF